jgi:hypothetical protein
MDFLLLQVLPRLIPIQEDGKLFTEWNFGPRLTAVPPQFDTAMSPHGPERKSRSLIRSPDRPVRAATAAG